MKKAYATSVSGLFVASFGLAWVAYAASGGLTVAGKPNSEVSSSSPPVQQEAGLGFTPSALSDSAAGTPPEVKMLRSIEKEIREMYNKETVEPSSIPSLVFTPAQHALLREARIGFNTRMPTLQELKDNPDPNDPNYRPPTALREISLGGIVFYSPDDWTIWLNGKRVTPDALPGEALDLRVYKEYIELRWFDSGTNQVYPVRLRPNQRFNIDGRMFLPG